MPVTITRGGITSAYTYTAGTELRSINHQYLATPLNHFGYTTDGVGNRLSSSELVASTVLTTTYGYDPLQRLRDVSYPALPGGPAASTHHYTLRAIASKSKTDIVCSKQRFLIGMSWFNGTKTKKDGNSIAHSC